MKLTYDQKKHFFEHGYVVVPGVVPPVMVDSAVKAINHSLGQEGIDPAQLTKFRAQSYCPEVTNSPEITGLFNATPASALVESVIGEGCLLPVTGCQIALRFPGYADPPNPSKPHLDGMYSPTNGMKEGTIMNFTALVGVMLSDLPTPYAGNFMVWPGTHRIFEKYFQEHGPQALLEGMPKVDMPEPVGVTARAGDIVIAHYMLGHSASPNVSAHVRYACFFRLWHKDQKRDSLETMTDIWKFWPGIRETFSAP
ncbi:MAG TPA: phytanoyl-CoA dioxygenase family protein [Capsulimonadaceae bacterium]|nr:phytanoyl-CoA dioxygenase family protein [Capsulimonadaceae bacterium]